MAEHRLREHWAEVVGDQIASHAQPDQIRFRKLYLAVDSPAWMQELAFLKPTLMEKVNAALRRFRADFHIQEVMNMKKGRRSSVVWAILMAIPWSFPITFFSFSIVPSMGSDPSSPGIILVADAASRTATISVSPKFYALNPCEKRQFTATVMDADGQEIKDAKVTWQSTSPEIAKIDEKGIAVGIKPGATLIKPIFSNSKGEPASLFVRDQGTDRDC